VILACHRLVGAGRREDRGRLDRDCLNDELVRRGVRVLIEKGEDSIGDGLDTSVELGVLEIVLDAANMVSVSRKPLSSKSARAESSPKKLK
jgi:hypothetical protein